MTKITSILAVVVFSCLSLIAQAKNPPTSLGNTDFPNGLEIPSAIAVDLTKNKFSFSLCVIAATGFQCNATAGTWSFVGPDGVFVNDCKDFNDAVDDPRFITAVALNDVETLVLFSCLSLIAQAKNPPTSLGNTDFPNGLEIPSAIAVDLTKNKFSFSLCVIAATGFQCNATAGTWSFVGPDGVFVNDCKDFNDAVDDPRFITAVALNDVETSSDLVIHSAGIRSAFTPDDTSTSIFTVEATTPAPNPSVDGVWLRSKASNQTGTGKFTQVTYLQRVFTKGSLTPPSSQCGSTYPDKYVYPSRFSATLLFYVAK
ncbi:hypothetical protein Glove_543g78 [Diversispora epigaea]|uniref:DOMON domain-containing protein n=1 Tax=Diversispora epigaea TaxID=1348612 RepID=A0A397GH09_9GLOM|nr:hypothetical protein Glove_543g78 [Diversispora epigaea]